MASRPLVLTLVFLTAATALSGCSGSKDPTEAGGGGETVRPALSDGKGAISGLLIDDIYRPIPNGLILLQGSAYTATSDELGQFQITDMAPGSYIALVSADGHEAAPVNVDVKAGEYTDLEISARRLFSDNGATVTSEYSVFISCAYDYVANGGVRDCMADSSGDSYRPGYTSDYTPYNKTATYLVVEMKANKVDRYEVQLREDDGSSGGGERYAVADINGDYLRVQFKVGEVNSEYNGQSNNVPFNVTKPMMLILFSDSQGREELQGAENQTVGAAEDAAGLGRQVCCGAGMHVGIKAKFIQTLFLGKPSVDVEHYCVLADKC